MPKKRKTKLSKRLTSLFRGVSMQTKLLLIGGLLLIFVPLFFYVNEGVQLAFFTPHVIPVKKLMAAPIWIEIPQVNIELPIVETALRGSTWEVSNHAISHLAISARPGEDGPIILYGHNTNDRFGPIRWLSTGQTIVLKTEDKKSYMYKIVRTEQVDPNQVSILVQQSGQTLILYTCDGFADLKRFVVIAKPL